MARLRKQIRAEIRKRAKNPRPRAQPVETLTVRPGQQKRFSDTHPQLLVSIEQTLVQARSQVDDIDDYVVEQALRASIRARPAKNPNTQTLVDLLDQVRREAGYEPEIWKTGLRVLYTSVKTRSDCRPGDHDYLNFAAGFVAKARRALSGGQSHPRPV